jgi:hypothetical protein
MDFMAFIMFSEVAKIITSLMNLSAVVDGAWEKYTIPQDDEDGLELTKATVVHRRDGGVVTISIQNKCGEEEKPKPVFVHIFPPNVDEIPLGYVFPCGDTEIKVSRNAMVKVEGNWFIFVSDSSDTEEESDSSSTLSD